MAEEFTADIPPGPWSKYQKAAPAPSEGPWTRYQSNAAPKPSAPSPSDPGFLEGVWNTVTSRLGRGEGVLTGKPNVLSQSEAIDRPMQYRPGMKMGEMMAQAPDRMANPMLFAMGTGKVGSAAAPSVLGNVIESTAGSKLGQAIAGKNPAAVDAAMTGAFRNVVKPSRVGRTTAPQIGSQDRQILTAVDQIIGNRQGLKLSDPMGNPLPPGSLPRTLRQFADGIDQTKQSIFTQYDQLAQQAGGKGITVDLAPVVEQLRDLAKKPEVVDLHPNLVTDAEQLAANFERRGSYTPSEAQDVIQNLNKTLEGFFKNPTHETVSRASYLAPVVKSLRESLDQSIEGATGGQYQALRRQYGALKSVEKDVSAAVQREANKIPGGMVGQFGGFLAKEEFLRGIITLNPAAVARAGGIQMARVAQRYLNSPNRAVTRLFERRMASQQPQSPLMGAIGASARAVGRSAVPATRSVAAPEEMKFVPGLRP